MPFQNGTELTALSNFRIVSEIARGGMGAVYRARQLGVEGFEKTVALKVILDQYTRSQDFVQQFIGEAKLVSNLVHENIVQIYQLGRSDVGYYISMEFVNGIDLNEFVGRHQNVGRMMPIELCAFIVSRLCRALEYAHTKADSMGNPLHVVHRDVSPSNVMITSGGVVKLTDFGIAKAKNLMKDEEGKILMGKAAYMSPEQADLKSTDGRSDVFAVGIVFWELLAGQRLFTGETEVATRYNILHKPVPSIRRINPNVSEAVEEIIFAALERDVSRRIDAATMGYRLERCIYDKGYGPTNVSLRNYLSDLFAGTDRLTADNVLASHETTSTAPLDDTTTAT